MSSETCSNSWHIFDGGLPKKGDICKCGQKQATDKIGVLKSAPPLDKESK